MRRTKWLAVLAALMVVAGACGSSKSTNAAGPTSSGTGSKPSYTLGILTEMTGLLAADGKVIPPSVKAAEGYFNAQGYNLKYVVADTGTSPTGALTAAHQLVEQDHVFAVIMISAVGFSAAPYLTSQGIPVIGSSSDGNEWTTSRNMFSVFGTPNYSSVQTTTGDILKLLGAHNYSAVAYAISPSSTQAAASEAESARLAGIKVGYLDTKFPFGDTNVGPTVLAMKAAGVDSASFLVEQASALAILQGLKQQGVTLKAPLISIGYGGDLLNSGPAAEQAATGAYFNVPMEPMELNTPATQQFAKNMQTYAGEPQDQISINQYLGYTSVFAFVQGLKAAGPNPTQAQLINAMLGIRSFNAAGLYGTHSVGFAMDQRGIGSAGADNCTFLVRWSGSSFKLVTGAEPICGKNVTGGSASGSSTSAG